MLFSVPLRVSGINASGESFTEQTSSLSLNAHGALIFLKELVRPNQMLSVTNLNTGNEISRSVIEWHPGLEGVAQVGVAFATPQPSFWHVSFPPDDWSSHT